jgi:hypothetical protein
VDRAVPDKLRVVNALEYRMLRHGCSISQLQGDRVKSKSPRMERATLIAQALEKRRYSPALRERIERLLDGVEDRKRLRCCNSGCFVCVQELLGIVQEVEEGMARE